MFGNNPADSNAPAKYLRSCKKNWNHPKYDSRKYNSCPACENEKKNEKKR